MEARGEPQNLDNFAAVSCGILQSGIWQNFLRKTVGPTHYTLA